MIFLTIFQQYVSMFYNLITFFYEEYIYVFVDKPWLIALTAISEGMTLIALPQQIYVPLQMNC